MREVVFHNNLYVGLVDSVFSQLLQTRGHEPGGYTLSTKIWSYREMIEISTPTVVPRHNAPYDTPTRPRNKTHTRITYQIAFRRLTGIRRA
jgi:hypothetical protein